jgi:hypothetical protein
MLSRQVAHLIDAIAAHRSKIVSVRSSRRLVALNFAHYFVLHV